MAIIVAAMGSRHVGDDRWKELYAEWNVDSALHADDPVAADAMSQRINLLIAVLHGRGDSDADIVGMMDHLPEPLQTAWRQFVLGDDGVVSINRGYLDARIQEVLMYWVETQAGEAALNAAHVDLLYDILEPLQGRRVDTGELNGAVGFLCVVNIVSLILSC
jgi:hypothetical protein